MRTGLEKRLLGCKLAAMNFGVIVSPTQCARDEVDHSPELEWMHWEENQRESAVSG